MLRTLPIIAARLAVVLIPLGLGACADSLTSGQSSRFSDLIRGYDKTLTKSEQKAAIDEMQNDAKQQETAREEETPTPAKAKPAAKTKAAQTQN